MFLVPEDFNVQPYNIANNTRVADNLQAFINDVEEDVLKKLLGLKLYRELVEAYEALPDDWDEAEEYDLDALVVSGNNIYRSLQATNTNHAVSDPSWWVIEEADNKWLKLVNGVDYEDDNEALYEWKGFVKMLRPIIYAKWTAANFDDDTGIGTVEPRFENGAVISPAQRIINAWNATDKIAGGRYGRVTDTLYGFLYYSADGVYVDWSYCGVGQLNSMDI